MKKVLGIVGSPRRDGNTHILVSRVLEGAKGRGAATDIVFLGELSIRECDGCHACWKTQKCAKNDDMIGLYGKIIESDVIVLGTPVYWYGPTALMKGLIDRLVYFNCPENRDKIKGKSAIVAIPFEEAKPETADLTLAFFTKCFEYLGINLLGSVIVPGVSEKGDVLKKGKCLEEGCDLGKRSVNR